MSEELGFLCVEDACGVRARYHVRSERALSAVTRFVLPIRSGSRIVVNQRRVDVRVEALEPWEPATLLGSGSRPREVYEAEFALDLLEGENDIVVEYAQPLGLIEKSRGHFTSSRFAFSFGYELWPLREWELDDAFTLKLGVEYRAAAGWLDWIRTPAPVVECVGSARSPAQAESSPTRFKRAWTRGRDRYAAEFGSDFPELLECTISSRRANQVGRSRLQRAPIEIPSFARTTHTVVARDGWIRAALGRSVPSHGRAATLRLSYRVLAR